MSPKKGKLYCKACEEEFELNKDEQNDYKIIKKIIHDDEEAAPIIIKEGFKNEKISAQDRKAFEEFFHGAEDSSY